MRSGRFPYDGKAFVRHRSGTSRRRALRRRAWPRCYRAARQSQFPSPLMRRGSALSIDGSILFCQFFRIPWTFLRVYRDGFGCHGLILGVSSSFSYRTKRAVLNVLQKRLEIAIANFFIGMHNPGKSQKRPRTVSFLAGELVECAHALRRRNSNLTQPALCLV